MAGSRYTVLLINWMHLMADQTYTMQSTLSVEKRWLKYTDEAMAGLPFENVSGNPVYQGIGMDYLVQCLSEVKVGLEYKYDGQKSRNVALECISQDWSKSRKGHHEGWMLTSQTGWLIYVFRQTGDALVLSMADLRAWMMANYTRFPTASTANRTYFSYNVLVPISVLCAELPADAWRWMDFRPYAPGEVFEPYKTTAQQRAHCIAMSELPLLLNSRPPRSEALQLTSAETEALHGHLWDANIMRNKHKVPDEKRGTLKLLSSLV